ncbi:MAG: tRNA (adenosine(37)-N6)-threonylcarbamoyltransferase complex ATPase subunit type 1 TsaE [Chloracidobacterium sp.]|uniref:tRNA threonylcarbamoyladenosine biosynthesis protein TsaE n=1 Tax=Chloracidobacterium validum TaxID=2821543 RepID=A0ABX8BBW5_9BACT|nr:tRNA (adenosine(37)-N6)-threonylcarbamoyltransferase complex ATPase subunit type 1 TsaE [Chloracidobacterium validum]QUW04338.1 tRNA (adenosine(37)-N6)-threonylcarbamoyltransferase complex ATPase subunit type 1 TsaE [Chloracidobacterium validum]
MTEQAYFSHSPEETFTLGYRLGQRIAAWTDPSGRVVWLRGDLGAGKTHFVKGLASAFGILPEDVTSPTFALAQAHAFQGGTLWHVDLYRLPAGSLIADAIGLDEMLTQPGVLAIEWPERLGPGFLAHHPTWQVEIDSLDDTRRRIIIRSPDAGGLG